MKLCDLINKIFNVFPQYTEDVANGVFVLEGEISEESAYMLIQKIFEYTEFSQSEITLYINSKGGSVSAGFAIYDVLQSVPNHIKTICVRNVHGIALLIASIGDENNRFFYKRTKISIGDVLVNDIIDENHSLELIDNIIKKYYVCIAERTHVNVRKLLQYAKKKKLPKRFVIEMGFAKTRD